MLIILDFLSHFFDTGSTQNHCHLQTTNPERNFLQVGFKNLSFFGCSVGELFGSHSSTMATDSSHSGFFPANLTFSHINFGKLTINVYTISKNNKISNNLTEKNS